MKRTFVACLFALSLLAPPTRAQELVPAPIPNIADIKSQMRSYFYSGRYEGEIASVTLQAQAYILARTHSTPGPVAIVFDVDETALSNWPAVEKLDFYYDPARWRDWIGWGAADPIRPVLFLYQFARARGIAVFFITGRLESERSVTEKNLRAVGYQGWDGLFMKKDDEKIATVPYKSGLRKSIAEKGYTILLNMGDQQSDLDGGYAEKVFKLPNPFYRID